MNLWRLGILLGVVILITLFIVSILYGATSIPLSEIFRSILVGLGIITTEFSPLDRIIFDLRLPRAISASVIGAGLGTVGVILQSITRNDLADPFLFGLSSGAASGAVFVITVSGDLLGIWTLPIAAFCGGLLASVIVLILIHRLQTNTPEKLILSGLAISFLFSAITNYLIFAGDSRAAHSIIFWMLGGLGLARWETLGMVSIGLFVLFIYSLYQHRSLDALLAGDNTATSLGVRVSAIRSRMFLISAFTTAIFVSVAGIIGFVGLMVPHIARGIVGSLHLRLLPTAAIIGAILLTGSDVISRIILAPQELPIGIITTSIGAIFVLILLFMMARTR